MGMSPGGCSPFQCGCPSVSAVSRITSALWVPLSLHAQLKMQLDKNKTQLDATQLDLAWLNSSPTANPPLSHPRPGNPFNVNEPKTQQTHTHTHTHRHSSCVAGLNSFLICLWFCLVSDNLGRVSFKFVALGQLHLSGVPHRPVFPPSVCLSVRTHIYSTYDVISFYCRRRRREQFLLVYRFIGSVYFNSQATIDWALLALKHKYFRQSL